MDADDRRSRETDEAARWWMRLGTRPPHEVPQDDREQFTQWLRESPLHVAEILHVAHVHDALERFKGWNEISGNPADEDDNLLPFDVHPEKGVARGPRMKFVMLAATVATVVVGVAMLLLPQLRGQSIATDRAERREVMLSDGSKVQLEPETVLRVKFKARERRITLERGRALFRVAKDSQRPFWVRADRTAVRAVGTAFGIERNNADIIITVSEGKVAVLAPDSRRATSEGETFRPPPTGPENAENHQSTSDAADRDAVMLSAGQQITVRSSGAAEAVREVDTTRALSWSEGRLVFQDASLAQVLEEFNRYNHVQLKVDDAELARRPVSGVFQASDPETLLAFIRAGARVSVTRQGANQLLISPSAE